MKVQENIDIYEIVSNNIRRYRKIRKLTQQQLAEKCNFSYGYIRRIESKKLKKHFSLQTLDIYAKALDIPIVFLLVK